MKSKSILLAAAAIAAIQCSSPTEKEANQSALSPDNVPSTFVDIDPTKDTIVAFPQGTTIRIPANAFIDEAGNVIGGNVQLELKECYKRADMILAGLTTEGEDGLLESDGMYFLNGRVDGKNIRIAEDKPLILAMPTDSFIPEMQAFRGEMQADGTILWKDPQEFLNATLEEEERTTEFQPSESIDVLAETQAIEPPKPLKYDDTDERVLSIEMDDPERFPELAMFQNVKFRVNEKSEFDRKDANQDWYSMDMTRTVNEGEYFLIFGGKGKKGEKIERRYIVNPVYEGSDYQKALKEYEAKYEKYKALKLKRQQTVQMQAEYLKRQVELEKNRLQAQQKKQLSQQEKLDRTKEILDRAASNQSRLQAERKIEQQQLVANSTIDYEMKRIEKQKKDTIETAKKYAERSAQILEKQKQVEETFKVFNYVQSVSSFGWYNCDAYLRNQRTLYSIIIKSDNLNSLKYKNLKAIIFTNNEKVQAYMNVRTQKEAIFTSSCISGPKTFLVFAYEADNYYVYSTKLVENEAINKTLKVELKEYTKDGFGKLIQTITQ